MSVALGVSRSECSARILQTKVDYSSRRCCSLQLALDRNSRKSEHDFFCTREGGTIATLRDPLYGNTPWRIDEHLFHAAPQSGYRTDHFSEGYIYDVRMSMSKHRPPGSA